MCFEDKINKLKYKWSLTLILQFCLGLGYREPPLPNLSVAGRLLEENIGKIFDFPILQNIFNNELVYFN